MALPVPNLDDRRFQDLVDDAKRLVQRTCPEWTDHNVSDPGVTLIEAFAGMVDQLLYRLNRVPDRNYVKFLELIGVRLYPPTAAAADVTYWLSAPQPESIVVPEGTQVTTMRTETTEAIAFTSVEHLDIVPSTLERLASSVEEGKYRDHSDAVPGGISFYCFSNEPKPGDAFYIGLDRAVPSCAVSLTFDCEIEGVGVDPRNPPLAWEAWTGTEWTWCEVDHDDTGGLNRAGEVVLHVPRGHDVSVIDKQRAGWVRCRVTEPEEGQPFYSASPRINRVTAATVGGTSNAVHAQVVDEELLGLSEGVAGQRLSLQYRPVVPGPAPMVVEVAGGDGWDEWQCVPTFAESAPDDRHFVVDEAAGLVHFGPEVREPDGTVTNYGAVPPKGAPIRVRTYRT
ncbi:MAG TPA: putative baseplate assembly protein, partial [Acidimicrobiales bacterium]